MLVLQVTSGLQPAVAYTLPDSQTANSCLLISHTASAATARLFIVCPQLGLVVLAEILSVTDRRLLSPTITGGAARGPEFLPRNIQP